MTGRGGRYGEFFGDGTPTDPIKPICPADFIRGDRVAHVSLGDGVVTAIEDGCVVVTYHKRYNNKPVIGKYGRIWFRENGHMFFKRERETGE